MTQTVIIFTEGVQQFERSAHWNFIVTWRFRPDTVSVGKWFLSFRRSVSPLSTRFSQSKILGTTVLPNTGNH